MELHRKSAKLRTAAGRKRCRTGTGATVAGRCPGRSRGNRGRRSRQSAVARPGRHRGIHTRRFLYRDDRPSPLPRRTRGSDKDQAAASPRRRRLRILWFQTLQSEISSELKVIGLTADEALDRVDKFLDQAYLAGIENVRIIHGHGKGILRKAIAKFLAGASAGRAIQPRNSRQGRRRRHSRRTKEVAGLRDYWTATKQVGPGYRGCLFSPDHLIYKHAAVFSRLPRRYQ